MPLVRLRPTRLFRKRERLVSSGAAHDSWQACTQVGLLHSACLMAARMAAVHPASSPTASASMCCRLVQAEGTTTELSHSICKGRAE